MPSNFRSGRARRIRPGSLNPVTPLNVEGRAPSPYVEADGPLAADAFRRVDAAQSLRTLAGTFGVVGTTLIQK